MKRLFLAIILCAYSHGIPAQVKIWVKVTEPMDHIVWSQVDDLNSVDTDCKADNVIPRVCLMRHLSRCRIIFTTKKSEIPVPIQKELIRMCGGYFPEPVLLQREFSNPNWYPNQGAPSADPTWRYQQ